MKIIGPPGGFGRLDRHPPPREGVVSALKENGSFSSGVRELCLDYASQIPFYSFFKVFSEEQKVGVEKIRKMALVLSELSGLDFERSLSAMEKTISASGGAGLGNVFSEASIKIQAALSAMSYENNGRVMYPFPSDLSLPALQAEELGLLQEVANQVDEKYTEIRGLVALGTVFEKRLKLFSFYSSTSEYELNINYESAVTLLSNPFFPEELRLKSLAHLDSRFDASATKEMLAEINSYSLVLKDSLTSLSLGYLKERNRLAKTYDVSEFDLKLDSPMLLASKDMLTIFKDQGANAVLELNVLAGTEVKAFKRPSSLSGRGPGL